MGTYVNPGNAAFREALNSRIYIDKTKLTLYTNSILNTTKKVYASAVPAVSVNLWQQRCLLHIIVKDVILRSYFLGRKPRKICLFLLI